MPRTQVETRVWLDQVVFSQIQLIVSMIAYIHPSRFVLRTALLGA